MRSDYRCGIHLTSTIGALLSTQALSGIAIEGLCEGLMQKAFSGELAA